MGILLIAFLGIIYLGSLLILDQFVDTRYIDVVFTILPLSFLIFYISTIGYLVLSTIEGLNKNWQKNIVVVGCQLIMLICALIWMPKFGVFGIFYAQLVQAISLLLSALTLVKINVPSYTVSALNRKKETMKSIMVYGLKFQAQSILLMLCDPVTKMFLSRYGGLSYVGIYEMASRAVLQVRTIIVSMVSNLVPKIVHIHSRNNEEEIRQSFKNVFNVNFDFFIFIFGAMILFAPLGVQVWLGKPNPELTWFIRYFLWVGF
jgi:O-antigen/teichoic acid export membrane protein